MPVIKQTFLKPGRYGSAGEWTKERIAAHVAGTKKLLAAGRNPPIVLEHPEIGSDDGSPRDRRAGEVKHGVGWVVGVEQAVDGSAAYELDVTDSEVQRKLNEGSIKFTSPEFRDAWIEKKDGVAVGPVFHKIIAHAALTHKPRAIDQGKLAQQFSLADYEGPIQFADDPKPDANHNMPKDNKPGEDEKHIEAIIAHLSVLGVGLPDDTNPETFYRDLLTALLTAEAMRNKVESEKPDDDNDLDPIREQQPMQRFSLADAEADKTPSKLLARAIRQEHDSAKQLAEKLIESGEMTPARRDRLFAHKGATQFSADGEYLPTFTLREVLDILAATPVNPVSGIRAEQFAEAVEQKHPRGEAFTKGDDSAEGKAQGEAYKAEQLKQRGHAAA